MDDKTIATMNEAEFDKLVEHFIKRGEDRVTPPTFLQVMTDIAACAVSRQLAPNNTDELG